MKTTLIVLATGLALLSSACSRSVPSASTSQVKDEFSMGGDQSGNDPFAMGGDDDFGMGGTDSCNPVEEGTDSLIGDYQQIDLTAANATNFPDIPFAFVGDGGSAVPVYSRAVQAILQDFPESENSIGKRSLYLKPNTRNAVKLMANQIMILGTEAQWLELTFDANKKVITVKRFKKGSAAPVSQSNLSFDHDFISTALRDFVPLVSYEFLQDRLFVVERLADDTISFEYKFDGAGATYSCAQIVGEGPYGTLEYLTGFGSSESDARNHVQSTCQDLLLVPGFENLDCSTATAFASCEKRAGVENLDLSAVVAKPKLSGTCLEKKSFEAADYAIGKYDDAKNQTTFAHAVAKTPLNTSFYIVANKKASDSITFDKLAKLFVRDGRSYNLTTVQENGNIGTETYNEFTLNNDEVIYIAFSTNIGVNQSVEISMSGNNIVVKEDRFGTKGTRTYSKFDGASYSIQFFGTTDSVVFNLGFNPTDTGALIGVATQKVIF